MTTKSLLPDNQAVPYRVGIDYSSNVRVMGNDAVIRFPSDAADDFYDQRFDFLDGFYEATVMGSATKVLRKAVWWKRVRTMLAFPLYALLSFLLVGILALLFGGLVMIDHITKLVIMGSVVMVIMFPLFYKSMNYIEVDVVDLKSSRGN